MEVEENKLWGRRKKENKIVKDEEEEKERKKLRERRNNKILEEEVLTWTVKLPRFDVPEKALLLLSKINASV